MQYNKVSTPIILFSFLLYFFMPAILYAETVQVKGWKITADKITYQEYPAMIIAEGNVILAKKEPVTEKYEADLKPIIEYEILTTVKADWIAYDVDLGTIRAEGNLLVDIGGDQITADTGIIDLNRKTGTFTNATITRTYKDIHLEGRVIEKTGELTYRIENGWIITCKLKEGETPPWSFAAADTKITAGGYAFLTHATFRIKNIPIFYTPIMILPVKRTRQTGLLFPGFAYSDRDGFDLTIPLFINLSPSSDITLYPQYMSKRGFMAGMEYRYVTSETTKGFFMANYLDDKLNDRSDPDNIGYLRTGNYSHDNQNRYWLRGKSNHKFGSWQARFDLDIVSDLDYLTEFNRGYTGFRTSHERFLEVFGRGFQNKTELARANTLKMLRSWSNGSALQVNLTGINDLRTKKDRNDPFWKLPAIHYTGIIPLPDTSVNFSWNTSYTNFWREQGVRGQRLDIPLRLSTALPITPYLEITVDGGIRNTSYLIDANDDHNWSGSDNENRFLFDFGGRTGTSLTRNFKINIGAIHKLNHILRPYISYRYLDQVDQSHLPNFDRIDRIAGQNIVYYGIDNFFSVFGRSDNREYRRNYGYLKIRQGYDFRSEEKDTPLTPVTIKAGFYPLKNLRLSYRSDIDVYGDGIIRQSINSSYSNQRGDRLYFNYFFNNDRSEIQGRESIRAGFAISLFHFLHASYNIEHSLSNNKTIEDNFSLTYLEKCWSVTFATNYTPDDRKFMLIFRLANIGTPFGLDLH